MQRKIENIGIELKKMEIYNDTYCVYAHINKINGKIYIGQTINGIYPDRRWQNGNGYKGCTLFYRAIQKYGWDSFEHEIIASNLTLEEANHFEELLIRKLDTTNPNKGYNLKSGGENNIFQDVSKVKVVESCRKSIIEKHKRIAEEKYLQRFLDGDKNILKCISCGSLFEINRKKQKNIKHCPDCRKYKNQKPFKKIIVCIDCGLEFAVDKKNNRSYRCKECRHKHQLQYQRNSMKNKRNTKS